MKMIFLGDEARDSGSAGFSDACPLDSCKHARLAERAMVLTSLPKQHEHSFSRQYRQSALRWRSCCCSCRPEPQHTDLPFECSRRLRPNPQELP